MLALGLAAFLSFGSVLVLIGANQAALARDLDLDLAGSGLLSATLILGLGVGLTGAGPIFDRYRRRPFFVAATLLNAASLLSVDSEMGFSRALLHVAALGLGCGVYETLLNAAVVEHYREGAPRPMSVLHAAGTAGAMLGPLAVGWLAGDGDWVASFRAIGLCQLGLAVWAMGVRFPAPERDRPVGSGLAPALVPFAFVAFAYVGVETSMTLFAIPYADDALSLGEDRGRFAISGLWLGLMTGRLFQIARRGPLDEKLLSLSGLAGGALLLSGSATGWSNPELWFGSVGFALGVVYPLMISLATLRVPDARGSAAGLVGGAGCVGGFVVPWLHGALGDLAGVRVAVGSLSLWCFLMAAAAIIAARRSRP